MAAPLPDAVGVQARIALFLAIADAYAALSAGGTAGKIVMIIPCFTAAAL